MASETVLGQSYKGWFEEPIDDNDKMYVAPDNLFVPHYVNLWEQYPQRKVAPYDQQKTFTCVANAVAAALWYALKLRDSPLMEPDGPSRLFIYWNARISELSQDSQSLPTDNGCYTRRAMRGLAKFGDCPENTWQFAPDRTQLEPEPGAYESAAHCKIALYSRLDPFRPVEDLTAKIMKEDSEATLLMVRQCLSEGYPVVVGFKYYIPFFILWEKHADGNWTLPNLWKDGKPAHGFDSHGHCVLIIGYDDTKRVVICQNSGGSNSTKKGVPIFYMPYEYVLDYHATSDFWTLRYQ
jgi:C1A family cysteine protease